MMKTKKQKMPQRINTSPASALQGKKPALMGFVDKRSSTALQRRLIQTIDNGPVTTLQRRQIEASFGQATQRFVEDEELLQGKFETLQRQGDLEEEELLQGKFETVQRQGILEEDELLQGKFETVQLIGPEDEELMQGKFETIQRQSLKEEELLQGKFEAIQQIENNTGLPDDLKAGIENLSGMDMSAVRVHKNSNKPAQLNALAYAQGNDIHLGSGQEQHLPHEAWHVVQQAQGRVKPTMHMAGEHINDDVGLEKEADVMGAKALQYKKD